MEEDCTVDRRNLSVAILCREARRAKGSSCFGLRRSSRSSRWTLCGSGRRYHYTPSKTATAGAVTDLPDCKCSATR